MLRKNKKINNNLSAINDNINQAMAKIDSKQKKRSYKGKNQFLILVSDMYERYKSHNVALSAAALTYYFTFAFFPLLIFSNNLLGFLRISPEFVMQYSALVPNDVLKIISSYLEYVSSVKSSSLLVFGLIFTIYIPFRAVNSLIKVICIAYDIKDTRSLMHRIVIIILLGIGIIGSIIGSILVNIVGRTVLEAIGKIIPISGVSIDVWNFYKVLIMAVVLFIVLLMLYLVGPSTVVHLKEALPGAIASLICWLLYSLFFSAYVNNFAKYSVIYGSIGTVIVLILWLYCASLTLILGSELNAQLKQMKMEKTRATKEK